jgi:hypothetical protein
MGFLDHRDYRRGDHCRRHYHRPEPLPYVGDFSSGAGKQLSIAQN